jgi:hypothetical protein
MQALRRAKVWICGWVLLIPILSVQAQTEPTEYRYLPETKLALGLGLGFNPNNLSDVKLPCIVFTERPLTKGVASTRLTATYVSNAKEESETNFDVRATTFRKDLLSVTNCHIREGQK